MSASSSPALAPLLVRGRIAALRSTLLDRDLDALVVTNLTNVRYLTGFTGSAGLLAVTAADAVLYTDGRYAVQAPEQLELAGAAVQVDSDQTRRRERVSAQVGGATRVALEADSVTWAAQRRFADWFSASELVASNGIVEAMREVKDDAELARIERAARIADQALAHVISDLATGRTERWIADALESEMRRLGATGAAYDTIVGSGPNAALPHARPTDRVIATGDLVVIDVGALVEGYRSDMTRTFAIGEPSATQREMLDLVTAAQAAGVAAVQPGEPTSVVDDAARGLLTDAGWGDRFVHGTGHGVGLDIHELPSVAATGTAIMAPGQVITIEPGLYDSAHGGVRVEDLVVVTPAGCRTLSTSPKDPVIS